jgi:hypothetical protein
MLKAKLHFRRTFIRTSARLSRLDRCIAALLATICWADPADASILYSHDSPWLLIVNQTNGSHTVVDSNSRNNSIEDLTSRHTEPGFLYGVENSLRGDAQLARIDERTGFTSVKPFFNPASPGNIPSFANGIAISSKNPRVATVTGSSRSAGQRIWQADVETGEMLGVGVEVPPLGPLAYSLDGNTLFSADDDGRLVAVDPLTGYVSIVGDPGLSDHIEGLAFRPEDGVLFAIDGFDVDNLVTLDPSTGALISIKGRLNFLGSHGLAFSIPEPTTLAIVAAALLFPSHRSRLTTRKKANRSNQRRTPS